MKPTKIPLTDLDYVCIYSEKLKNDSSTFKQQKIFIESQYKGSSSLFRQSFGKGNTFKINARKYLKERNII